MEPHTVVLAVAFVLFVAALAVLLVLLYRQPERLADTIAKPLGARLEHLTDALERQVGRLDEHERRLSTLEGVLGADDTLALRPTRRV